MNRTLYRWLSNTRQQDEYIRSQGRINTQNVPMYSNGVKRGGNSTKSHGAKRFLELGGLVLFVRTEYIHALRRQYRELKICGYFHLAAVAEALKL